jgi:hypothetical protein
MNTRRVIYGDLAPLDGWFVEVALPCSRPAGELKKKKKKKKKTVNRVLSKRGRANHSAQVDIEMDHLPGHVARGWRAKCARPPSTAAGGGSRSRRQRPNRMRADAPLGGWPCCVRV